VKIIELPEDGDQSEYAVEFRRRLREWGINRYRPLKGPEHNDQWGFHQNPATVRLIIGSNRSGKTQSPLAEAAALALGSPYPFWWGWHNRPQGTPDPPCTIWIIVPQFVDDPIADDARIKKLYIGEEGSDKHGNRVHRPPLIPEEMIAWRTQDYYSVRLVNGSTITFKATTQNTLNLASSNVDLIIFDEPTNRPHWNEAVARLIALPGSRIIHCCTDTTLKTKYIDDLLSKPEKIPVFHWTTDKNPYRNKAHTEEIAELMDEAERKVRLGGARFSETLLVYPSIFRWVDENGMAIVDRQGRTSNWIEPFVPPQHWTRYVIHDPGRTNPAAAVWFAVDEMGNVYAYKMHYWKKPPTSLTVLMKGMMDTNAGDRIDFWYIDPKAAKQPREVEEYYVKGYRLIDMYRKVGKKFGIYWRLGSSNLERAWKMERVSACSCYLDPREDSYPMLWLFDTPEMEPLREEFRRYRMATAKDPEKNQPETTHDADNHAIYCVEAACVMPARYFPREVLAYDYMDHMNNFMTGSAGEGYGNVSGRA
jgi:hypothetical protein